MASYTTAGRHSCHTNLQGTEKEDAYQGHSRHFLHAHPCWLARLGTRFYTTMKAYKFF